MVVMIARLSVVVSSYSRRFEVECESVKSSRVELESVKVVWVDREGVRGGVGLFEFGIQITITLHENFIRFHVLHSKIHRTTTTSYECTKILSAFTTSHKLSSTLS